MNITQLKYFIAVYEEKNITQAAKRSFISQPSISNAIKELELELGIQLFVRTKKGVDITKKAHHFYPLSVRLVNDMNKLSNIFKNQKKILPITLSIFPNLSQKHLTKILNKIKNSEKEFKISLVENKSEADMRITIDVLKHKHETFLPLWEEDYILCANKEHPITKQKEIYPHDLHNLNFIECPACEAHQQTIGLLGSDGMNMNIIATAEDKSLVATLVQTGIGVSFLPTGLLESTPNLVQIPFIGPRMFRRIGLCYSSNKSATENIAEIIKILT
jgi:DNA-binding transcriptional LysR family regulator